jgi:CheY-like chemotaxis protein
MGRHPFRDGASREDGEHGRPRVLVVDSSAVTADSMAILLRLHGYEARAVYHATEALDAALAFGPDAVLLEVCMPILDGFQVGRLIRDHNGLRDVILLAVTGYLNHTDLPGVDEGLFDYYLLKPVVMNELDVLLRKALDPARSGE